MLLVKLLRIDGDNNEIIELTDKSIFGRGQILLCQEKNISRTHAELEVLQDAMRLTALHINPCFYKKKKMEGFKILKKGDAVDLTDGEIFGLLPYNFWYKVKFHGSVNTEERNEAEASVETQETQPVVKVEVNEQTDTATQQEGAEKRKLSLTEEAADSGTPPAKVKPNGEAMASTSADTTAEDLQNDSDSADQAMSAAVPAPADNALDPVIPPQQIGRERCFYGASCFRRNPAHKAQFSHPGDGDWGFGDMGECPFGATCSRHDPRHWSTHRHPPGATPPPPPAQRDTEEQHTEEETQGSLQDHCIEIKVWVKTVQFEGEQTLLVKPHMTIDELATQCEQQWGVPVALQYWIIGLVHYPYGTILEEAAGPGLNDQFCVIIENATVSPDSSPQQQLQQQLQQQHEQQHEQQHQQHNEQQQQGWMCHVCGAQFGPKAGIMNLDCGHMYCLCCIVDAVGRASCPPFLCVRSGCFICGYT